MGIETETPSVWTPPSWQFSPDQLIQMAQQQLWEDQRDIVAGALDSDQNISGPITGTQNENENTYNVSKIGLENRDGEDMRNSVKAWDYEVDKNMRRTEPLAGWANGMKDGPANPQP